MRARHLRACGIGTAGILRVVALAALAMTLGIGCGPQPPEGGADTGEDAVDGGESRDVSDTDAGAPDTSCPVRVDGSCSCQYRGRSEGVCGDADFARDGSCERPFGYETTEQSCGDGVDNDCDGQIDCADPDCAGDQCGVGQGGAQCVASECVETVCFDGVDNDRDGDADCADDDCTGETCAQGTERTCPQPSNWADDESEMCDGIDNDCDGAVDEGCSCTYDPTEPSAVDTDGDHEDGLCTGQTRNARGRCSRPALFEPRTGGELACDDKDNDCDGNVDEGCRCTFDPDESNNVDMDESHDAGVCLRQRRTASGECVKPSGFEPKTADESACDGRDNDCDGKTDEGCPCVFDPNQQNQVDTDLSHSTGVCTGQSRDGSGVCNRPAGFEARTDVESSCNGDDNDCDGQVDEGCVCTYDPDEPNETDTDGSHGSGVCTMQGRDANKNCKRPSGFESRTKTESSCQGDDNDCDGFVDEGCSCVYDPSEPKSVDTDGSNNNGSVCPGQTRDRRGTCKRPGDYEAPTGSESLCAGDDNDCDGYVDEGCPCSYDPAEPNNVDTDGTHTSGVCTNRTRTRRGVCPKPSTYEADTDTESTCSGRDNDCDGVVDEGCTCVYDPSEPNDIDTDSSNDAGVCVGRTVTTSGNCPKPTGYQAPETTKCADGVDNDCDGVTDETPRPQSVGQSCSNDCECKTGLCQGGTCVHQIFVSSTTHDGKFGGVAAIDAECEQLATSAGLPGDWRAVVSDSNVDAKSRISVSADIYLVETSSGSTSRVATPGTIWSSSDNLEAAVDRDEKGNTATDDVWTGTASDGTKESSLSASFCNNWDDNSSTTRGVYGESGRTDGAWIDAGKQFCSNSNRFYCINGQ